MMSAEVFSQACRVMPELARGKPLGMGVFGLAVGGNDDSVTKVIFNHKSGLQGLDAAEIALSEVNNLRIMRDYCDGRKVAGLDVPVLLREPRQFDDDKNFIMAFKMSRVPGVAAPWFEAPFLHKTFEEKAAHYQDAGRILARFHTAAAKMPFNRMATAGWRAGEAIPQVPHLSDHINQGLAAAQEYLQAHAVPGVRHGDFHGGNIMLDADGRVSGLIDLSMAGQTTNIYGDFSFIPDDHITDFLEGYEEAGGKAPPREMFTVVNLGWMANSARVTADDPAAQMAAVQNINASLNKLTFATGHKP